MQSMGLNKKTIQTVFYFICISFIIYSSKYCTADGDIKMENDNNQNPIIQIINLSGEIKYNNSIVNKNTKIGYGRLTAIGESSWVDFNYFHGKDVIRLNNGSLELNSNSIDSSIADELGIGSLSNTGIPMGNTSPVNSMPLDLLSGKLYVHLEKFTQPRKMIYDFTTPLVSIDLEYATYFIEVKNKATQISVCDSTLSILPSIDNTNSKFKKIQITRGNTVLVNNKDKPIVVVITKSQREHLTNMFTEMGVTACSSS